MSTHTVPPAVDHAQRQGWQGHPPINPHTSTWHMKTPQNDNTHFYVCRCSMRPFGVGCHADASQSSSGLQALARHSCASRLLLLQLSKERWYTSTSSTNLVPHGASFFTAVCVCVLHVGAGCTIGRALSSQDVMQGIPAGDCAGPLVASQPSGAAGCHGQHQGGQTHELLRPCSHTAGTLLDITTIPTITQQ